MSTSALQSDVMSNVEELVTTSLNGDDGDDVTLKVMAIVNALPKEDKRILCYYAELRSFRLMADALGASATTWRREIVRIRQQIIEQL